MISMKPNKSLKVQESVLYIIKSLRSLIKGMWLFKQFLILRFFTSISSWYKMDVDTLRFLLC